jgi:hypothetical protein
MTDHIGTATAGAEGLDPCGCCEKGLPQLQLYNRPGLPALRYRIGTQPVFLQRLLARLPQVRLPDDPADPHAGTYPLQQLTTRAVDDPAIALLDAWAATADVLTFYQERIANEGFLRTATERRSVLELARAIGYELSPGVAASTFLAFTVEDAPGAPGRAVVDAGVKVLSVPGQNERPQTFETIEQIEARAEWNALRPQRLESQSIGRGTRELYLKGLNTQLQPGDGLLLVGNERTADPGSERWDFRIVQTVTPVPQDDPERSYTVVTWQEGLGSNRPPVEPADNPRAFAFRLRAALFGHNAPDWRAMPDSIKRAYGGTDEWPDFSLRDNRIDLDALYPKVLPQSWVVLARPDYVELYRARSVIAYARTDFTLTAQVTRIEPDTTENLAGFGLRQTVVYAQSEELVPAERPIASPVQGIEIVIEGSVAGLAAGRTLIFTGRPAAAPPESEPVSEVAFVESIGADGRTITLTAPLQNAFVRESLVINANVARATHGETVREVLGSGNGAASHQRFTLKKPPLTYISASTPSGALSTLQVRVNRVLWQEVPSLYAQEPDAQVYSVRLEDEGSTTVIFGDGQSGARLPTGQENIEATYRSGIGLAGQVRAGSLTLLQTRPLGIRGVTNPVRASGAAAPEALDEARTNAPLTVLTLERAVSLQDFEDFARAFAGIGKAQAVALWSGETRLVHVTVAAADGSQVDPQSDLFKNLRSAIEAVKDPVQPVEIAGFIPRSFSLEARLFIDPRYHPEDVLAQVRQALLDAFSFAQRAFGRPVAAAEAITVIQAVTGVIAVDLDRLELDPLPRAQLAPITTAATVAVAAPATAVAALPAALPVLRPVRPELRINWSSLRLRPPIPAAVHPATVLPAHAARLVANRIELAELLLINPSGIRLEEMTP